MYSNIYNINNINELDSPALVVFEEIVIQNIQKAVEMISEVARLRPHIKTHKTAEVTKLCQAAGIHKFKCATIAEAELLGICEAADVLLAYQPIGPKALRFKQLIEKYPKTHYSCLIDSIDVLASHAKYGFDLYIDLNTGMNRTGISPENAVGLAIAIKEIPNLNLLGVHAYDGNIHEKDLAKRKIECDDSFEKASKFAEDLQKLGFENQTIIIGGSPSYPFHAKRQNVECSPGTFVFWDKGYTDTCPEQPFLPAVLAITRIISLPTPTQICTDLGHKSIAPENELESRVFFLNQPQIIRFISQSEEHLVLEVPENHNYKIGDILFGIPIHICPTVALHEKLHLVEKEILTGKKWKVAARDRCLNI
jgi:D-threonine aldolase